MEKKNQKTSASNKSSKKTAKQNKFQSWTSSAWFIPLLLFVITFIAYINSFGVPFQFDDHNQISYREWCHTFDYYKNFSNWLKVNDRPFAFFTITINYVLHGESVLGYHLVNFFIHFAAGLFLYKWLLLLANHGVNEIKKSWFPLVVTVFFLVHPVQTQSVTYIIQRMSSLAGFCLIASLYFYTKGRLKHIGDDNFKSGIFYYIVSLFVGVLGVLSKQNAIIFPLILLLTEFFFIRNKDGKIYRNYLLFSSGTILLIFLAILFFMGLPAETTSITRIQYLGTQMIVIPRYFQMMLLPFGLSIDHGVKIVDHFFNLKSVLGLLLLLGIIAYGIIMAKKNPLAIFGILWIFITLSVESSILPITDPMFDQRMYLPLVGFAISLWSILDYYLFSKKPDLLLRVAVISLFILLIMTVARNQVWNSRVKIWADVTEKYPDYLRGWKALGKMYLNDEEKDIQKAIASFEKVRTIDPDDEENLIDLGFAYMSARQEDKAISCYKKLLNAKNKEYRGQALKVMSAYNVSKGDVDESARYLREILAKDPKNIDTWKLLFAVYFDKKEYSKALNISREWLQKSPDSADANYLTGKALFYLNEKDSSADYLKQSLAIDPQHAEAMMIYANIMVNKFQYDQAITMLEKAYSISKNATIPANIELIKKIKNKELKQ